MKFLADESIDRQIVERLRQEGHTVLYVAEMEPGLADDAVLETASRERIVLLTADKDFGELVFRLHRISSGVVLFRLAGLSSELKAEVATKVIRRYGLDFQENFTVIGRSSLRIRKKK
ncbi:MAG: DUF5615 family PIN-like protein [bacterium]